jgi:hypothetical protein
MLVKDDFEISRNEMAVTLVIHTEYSLTLNGYESLKNTKTTHSYG